MDNLKLICFALLFFPLGGCDIFDCGEDIVPVSYLSTRTSCIYNNYLPSDDENFIIVISDEIEFNEHLKCDHLLEEIDFEHYALLIGRYKHHSCGHLISQRLNARCNSTNFEIEVQNLECAELSVITFGAIIPKGFENERFRLRVKERI